MVMYLRTTKVVLEGFWLIWKRDYIQTPTFNWGISSSGKTNGNIVGKPIQKAPAVSKKDLLSYIQQNLPFSYSLHSHLADISSPYVRKIYSRYFREHFQLTLSQYITYLRLSHAKHLLETTSLSITETALQSGFPNVSYFIRTFKNTFHVPASAYRNSIR